MSSFTRLAAFPVGYFRATCSWLLRHRRSIAARVRVINAEIARIGFVNVTYESIQEGDHIKKTEARVGISATPGSTLEKLLRAYIANGGNPFDISAFSMPDTTTIVGEDYSGNPIIKQRYPYGGIVAPKSANYNEPLPKISQDEDGNEVIEESGFGAFPGGFVENTRYNPARMGGRIDRGSYDSNTVVRTMHRIRAWANQDIRHVLNDLEWRIIKQMDLREQLELERDELLQQAFGGTLKGLPEIDEDAIDPGQRVQNLISDMNKLLFLTDESGRVVSYDYSPVAGLAVFAFPDDVSEKRDAKGG